VARAVAWSRLTVLLLIFGFLIRAPGLLGVGAFMLVVLLASWWWNRNSLRGVSYQRRLRYWRAFPGEQADVDVVIENRKVLPLTWLTSVDRWPVSLTPSEQGILQPSAAKGLGLLVLSMMLRSYERIHRRFTIIFQSRGLYDVGPSQAVSGDPFGLFASEARVAEARPVVVFPRVRQLADLGFKAADPFGGRRAPRRLFEDVSLTIGVREYQPEDGFRRIHWPATARTGHLQSRMYQSVSGLDLVVCLNVSTYEKPWLGTWPELFDALIEAAATIIKESFEQGYRVGLISNGGRARAGRPFRIALGRTQSHLATMLMALSSVTPIVTAPFDRYLMASAPQIEYGSCLVVVTGVTTPELAIALQHLQARSRRLTLYSLSQDEPPFLPGVQIVHQPFVSKAWIA
jgi:uncharacterized protein (DUF58 family)